MLIGVISDTHGAISSHALAALKGVDHIFHAGDVGDSDVLMLLNSIAPTTAVRGNMDGGTWSKNLPTNDIIDLSGTLFYIVHDLYKMDIDPLIARIKVVISGHTHQPDIKYYKGILYFNPGSASHGRYGNPPSVGRIELTPGKIIPRIMPIGA